MAVLIFLAMAGTVVLPLFWWLLAFWQWKNRLVGFFYASISLSLMPICSWLLLYYGKEVSAKHAMIIFSLLPFVNIITLIFLVVVTIVKVRNRRRL